MSVQSYFVISVPVQKNCEAYSKNQCSLRNGPSGLGYCPYGKVITEDGYTRKAKGYYKQIEEWKQRYPLVTEKYLEPCKYFSKVGDYFFLPLRFLHNYTNSIDKELNILHECFIPCKNFTPEVIKRLCEYEPRSLMGGVIRSYQKEEVPKFLLQLKFFNNPIYEETIKKYPELDEITKKGTFKGEEAKLKTLSPGKVKINASYYDWNGENIITDKGILLSLFQKGNCEVKLTPDDDFVVTICEDDTVNKNTVFV